MLSLPSLPTDNLYKFIFLAGLTLFIYSAYLQDGHEDNVSRKKDALDSLLITAKENARLTKVSTENKAKEVDEIAEVTRPLLKKLDITDIKNTREINSLKRQLAKTLVMLEKKRNELNSLGTEVEVQSISLEIGTNQISTSMGTSMYKIRQLRFYQIIGGILFLAGGFLWLFVVQIPQDKLFKIQIALATNQLKREQMHGSNALDEQSDNNLEV